MSKNPDIAAQCACLPAYNTNKILRWAASNYENISRVHVGPERLWRPDIMVYNSVEHFDYETTDLLLTSDGTVRSNNPVNDSLMEGIRLY